MKTSRAVAWGALLPTLLVGLVAACDTEVINPGRVQEKFLERSEAHASIANGAGRALAEAVNFVAYTGAAITREIHPSGSTGSFGITLKWQRGELDRDDDALNTHWNNAQQARWMAEDGVAKITAADESDAGILAQTYLWAGYANRLLGENFCEAVIDGGAPQDRTEYLNRALANFNQAASLGSGDVQTAAVAGRAAVKVFLGDWAGAVQDAGTVPDDFEYVLPYYMTEGDDTKNRLFWATAAEPYKAHTVWSTKYEDYGMSVTDDDSLTPNPDGDPRVAFVLTDETGDAAIDCCGQVPWYPPLKYNDARGQSDDVPLSKGGEMRLIEAEAMLRDGNMDGAMTKINALRTAAGVAEKTAATMDEAWTALKAERGIVLWLEGRRLGDFYRWDRDNTPGDLDPLETPSGDTNVGSHLVMQDLCFPTPPSEQDTNANVP